MRPCAGRFFDVLFFFNDTATTEIYTLSLHDALPIYTRRSPTENIRCCAGSAPESRSSKSPPSSARSGEHTSELQSPCNLVCRLLLEKLKAPRQDVPGRRRHRDRGGDQPRARQPRRWP